LLTIKDLGDALIYLGGVAGALAAIGVVLRYVVVQPLKKWMREQVKPPLEQVRAEVSHNSGHSLKDAVSRVERKVDRLDERLDAHIDNHPGG
jgi:hypothetical protein